jgi:hypothetical protein
MEMASRRSSRAAEVLPPLTREHHRLCPFPPSRVVVGGPLLACQCDLIARVEAAVLAAIEEGRRAA